MASVDIDYDRIDEDKETKHAIFVIIEEDDIAVWLPKSQVKVDEKRKIITMPEWLAEDKDLL